MSISGMGNSSLVATLLNASIAKDTSTQAMASLAAAASPANNSPASNASWATLGGVVDDSVVYAKPLALSALGSAWASSPTDDISALMQKNMTGNSTDAWTASSLLDGLGGKLLERFSTLQSNFSQTVVSYLQTNASVADAARVASAQALAAAKLAPNNIALTVSTVSGKTVNVAISFGSDGFANSNALSVAVQVDGELTADEQKAVAQLSKGFEAALAGLSKVPPSVDLSALVDYDARVLSGVDLHVSQTPRQNVELKSFDFHADATRRSFSMESVSGKISVSVDLSHPEILGSAAQQKEALNAYLSRFDAASRRGHGDATSIAQFKAAFSQLNSNYPAANPLSVSRLNGNDRSALSGLADFKASMSSDFTDAGVGRNTTEEGHIEYRAAQKTEILGRDKYTGLTLTQTQSASLKSDFVKSRNGAMLDTRTGNYDTYHISDESSTTTTISYARNMLKTATIQRLVKQFEDYQKRVDDKVVEQRETPRSEASQQDITAAMQKSYKEMRQAFSPF